MNKWYSLSIEKINYNFKGNKDVNKLRSSTVLLIKSQKSMRIWNQNSLPLEKLTILSIYMKTKHQIKTSILILA